jgi:hypothetical protein
MNDMRKLMEAVKPLFEQSETVLNENMSDWLATGGAEAERKLRGER